MGPVSSLTTESTFMKWTHGPTWTRAAQSWSSRTTILRDVPLFQHTWAESMGDLQAASGVLKQTGKTCRTLDPALNKYVALIDITHHLFLFWRRAEGSSLPLWPREGGWAEPLWALTAGTTRASPKSLETFEAGVLNFLPWIADAHRQNNYEADFVVGVSN